MPGCGVLSEEFVARCVERLRRDVPDAVAIRFGGSQLHGDAGPYSDVDFDVWVPEGPRDEWPSWLDSDGGRLVRVSSWIRDVDAWLADRGEPQAWAFCLPCADRARLCWYADESWRERVTSAESTFPAGPPEIDHFEGYAGKVANAWHAGDELALRLAAQDLAGSVISVLQPLNPRPPVHSRRGALDTVLGYDVVPDGYRDDLLACLGLTGNSTAGGLYASACRLIRGALELLDTHMSTFVELSPESSAALRNGTLRRWVEHALDGAAPGPGLAG